MEARNACRAVVHAIDQAATADGAADPATQLSGLGRLAVPPASLREVVLDLLRDDTGSWYLLAVKRVEWDDPASTASTAAPAPAASRPQRRARSARPAPQPLARARCPVEDAGRTDVPAGGRRPCPRAANGGDGSGPSASSASLLPGGQGRQNARPAQRRSMSARQTLQRYASALEAEEGEAGPVVSAAAQRRPASASQTGGPGTEDELGALLARVDAKAGELKSDAAPIPTGPPAPSARTPREPESQQAAPRAGPRGDSRARRLSQAKSEEMARFREAARALMARQRGRHRPSKDQVRRVGLRVAASRDVAGAVDAETRPLQSEAATAAPTTAAPTTATGQPPRERRRATRRLQRRASESGSTRVRARTAARAAHDAESALKPIRTSPVSHDAPDCGEGAGQGEAGEEGVDRAGAESPAPLSEPPQSPLLSPPRNVRASGSGGEGGDEAAPKRPSPRPLTSRGAVAWTDPSGRREGEGAAGAAGITPGSKLRPRIRTPGTSEGEDLDSTIGSGWSALSPRSTLQRSPFSALEQATSTPHSADDRPPRRVRGSRRETSARESTSSSQRGSGLGPRPTAAADEELQIADAAREQLAALEADLAALTPLSSNSSTSGFHGPKDEASPQKPRH